MKPADKSPTSAKSDPPTPAIRQRLQNAQQILKSPGVSGAGNDAARSIAASPATTQSPGSTTFSSGNINVAELPFGTSVTTSTGLPVKTRTDKIVDSSGNVVTRTVYEVVSIERSSQKAQEPQTSVIRSSVPTSSSTTTTSTRQSLPSSSPQPNVQTSTQRSGTLVGDNKVPAPLSLIQRSLANHTDVTKTTTTTVTSGSSSIPSRTTVTNSSSGKTFSDILGPSADVIKGPLEKSKKSPVDMVYATPSRSASQAGSAVPVISQSATSVRADELQTPQTITTPSKTKVKIELEKPSQIRSKISSISRLDSAAASKAPSQKVVSAELTQKAVDVSQQSSDKMVSDKNIAQPSDASRKADVKSDSNIFTGSANVSNPKGVNSDGPIARDRSLVTDATPGATKEVTSASKDLQIKSNERKVKEIPTETVSKEPDIAVEPIGPLQETNRRKSSDSDSQNADMINLPIIRTTKNPINYNTIEQDDYPADTPNGNGKNLSLQLPTDLNPPTRPYPKKVFFVVGNEFCERFSYYGFRTILVLYFRQVLGLSESDSTVYFHLFAALCYFTPLLGAILADTIWGKFKTIIRLSIVYLLGEIIVLIGSVYWDSRDLCYACTAIGLFLVGLGTGGIKPCVGALGADQFYDNEGERRVMFFSMFYGSINVGSLLSSFATPLLRSQFQCVDRDDCYPFAFAIPSILMFVSVIVILIARDQFYNAPLPEKNVILAFGRCTYLALKRKFFDRAAREMRSNTGDSSDGNQRQLPLGESRSGNTSNSSLANDDDSPIIKDEDVKGDGSPTTKSRASGGGDLPAAKDRDIGGEINGRLTQSQLTLSDSAYQKNNFGSSRANSNDQLLNGDEHWLYLAKDVFDTKTIEDFRSVLAILMVMLPLPLYWTLYDQQGSMWTLQASRMNGQISSSPDIVMQPDQITFLNSFLVITGIPIFQYIIYPVFAKFNMLTNSVTRITVGGMLAALAFVFCALAEFGIQGALPLSHPIPGNANLLVINGLSGCTMNNSIISNAIANEVIPSQLNQMESITGFTMRKKRASVDSTYIKPSIIPLNWKPFGHLSPLHSRYITMPSSADQAYHLKFNLVSPKLHSLNGEPSACQFADPLAEYRLSLEPLQDGANKLLYLDQGNGRLAYRMFDDSLELPPPGKARVRLLFSSFGSPKVAEKQRFILTPEELITKYPQHQNLSYYHEQSNNSLINHHIAGNPKRFVKHKENQHFEFKPRAKDGQVFLSDYLDVDVSHRGQIMRLQSIGNQTLDISPHEGHDGIYLKPGTRNLLVFNQMNATYGQINHELLQDNDYRISILYQVPAIVTISMSEIMFSITVTEFSYSMAPESMKSIVMAANLLTVGIGNILTVVIQSLHPFSNLAGNFLFYSALMVLDMILFAVLGRKFKPREAYVKI